MVYCMIAALLLGLVLTGLMFWELAQWAEPPYAALAGLLTFGVVCAGVLGFLLEGVLP